MKKFYTVAMAIAVALSAAAIAPKQAKMQKAQGVKMEKVRANSGMVLETKMQQFRKTQEDAAKYAEIAKANKARKKAIAKAEGDMEDVPEPIFGPDGESKSYTNTATQFASSFFGITYSQATVPGNIVWGEDGEVFIADLVSSVTTGCYVKGTYADGKITVELPQICYAEEDEGEMFALFASVCEVYEFEEDGETYLGYRNVDGEKQTIVYNIDEEGVISLTLNDGDPADVNVIPPFIIGLVDDTTPGVDAWYGYGDSYQSYAEFNEEPNVLPEGVELEDWVFVANNNSGPAKVGFKDGKVYITDCWEYNPEAVIIGSVEGDKVIIEPQYLGETYGYFIYAVGCQWEDDSFEDYVLLDKMEMKYDAEAKRISTDNDLIDFLFNIGISEYNPADYYENVTFLYQTEEQTNADPAAPYVTYFDAYAYRDYMDDSEGYIDWEIPYTNVNGFLLNPSKMYYNIYYNDELHTFTTDVYPEIDEDMTNVPFEYTEGWDIQVAGTEHYITFKGEDYWKFGCQSFYIGSDNKVYKSELVTYIPEEYEGVEGISGDFKDIQSVEMFNLQGQRVTNPGAGLYIMRQTYTDGTSRSIKIVK